MTRLFVGQSASKKRVFTVAVVQAYRDLTGDRGLSTGCDGTAAETVPGPLLGGLISDLLGTELPGRGTNWLKQHYLFEAAAIIGQELSAAVQVSRLRPEKGLVNLSIRISGPDEALVCSGEALVLVKDLEVI